ncbi:heat shock cognate 70 kDa protein 2 [Tanacetum coccineum]|uniref:Heat shock cognate 70 kDa protein 2 n=1 Tax=Tanacetum coccineum TaxID=301880 RepID=A0ABQ5CT37_9ASTR
MHRKTRDPTIDYKGEEKIFTAEEIFSMDLIKMKEIALAFFGATVKNAPHGFLNSSRAVESSMTDSELKGNGMVDKS